MTFIFLNIICKSLVKNIPVHTNWLCSAGWSNRKIKISYGESWCGRKVHLDRNLVDVIIAQCSLVQSIAGVCFYVNKPSTKNKVRYDGLHWSGNKAICK